jgi:hypothetical protein
MPARDPCCEAGASKYLVSDCVPTGIIFSETTKPMALHRDIYWVGKQWAVTGLGIQACNQRQRGQFDIAASRLWEDGVQDAVRAEQWVNVDDFEKAVTVARKYYPEPPLEVPAKVAAPKFDMHVEGLGAKLTPVWRIRSGIPVQPGNR